MKRNRLLTVLCSLALCGSFCTALPAAAAEQPAAAVTAAAEDGNTRATGLISFGMVSITSGTRKIDIEAHVYATDVMARIGFKNIRVQHSTDGVSNWETEVILAEKVKSLASSNSITSHTVYVSGGYYYRLVLDYYAKEQGWFFPGSQTLGGQSEVLWVSPPQT